MKIIADRNLFADIDILSQLYICKETETVQLEQCGAHLINDFRYLFKCSFTINRGTSIYTSILGLNIEIISPTLLAIMIKTVNKI